MSDEECTAFLAPVGFEQPPRCRVRFQTRRGAGEWGEFVRLLLAAAVRLHRRIASADSSLINFPSGSSFRSRTSRAGSSRKLVDHPRSVEILVKLFVGSLFLTEILLRNPSYLDRLTQHQRLPEIKSRERFAEEASEGGRAVRDLRRAR